MNKRLDLLYEMIPDNGRGVIDVGTDHGQIPIRLAVSGYKGHILASDVAEGPLKTARAAAHAAGVEKHIHFLLCDGLDLCPQEEVSDILIAGMGGDTICGILNRAEWLSSGRYRLILQPMTKPEVVRYWLIHNEFSIDLEAVAREDQHVYQMFRAVPGHSKSMSDAEYLIGSGSVPRRGDKICFVIDQQLRTITKKLNGYPTQKAAESPEYAFYLNMKRELEVMKASIHSKESGNG